MCLYDLLHPDSREKITEHCNALLRSSAVPVRCELKTITREGDERWIDFTSSIIDYQGKKCGMGTAYDITDRKQAEQTLKEREERLRLLVERVRDYEIFMLDPEGRLFFSIGLNHIDSATLRCTQSDGAWERESGNDMESWLGRVGDDLRDWGFNTVGWVRILRAPRQAHARTSRATRDLTPQRRLRSMSGRCRAMQWPAARANTSCHDRRISHQETGTCCTD